MRISNIRNLLNLKITVIFFITPRISSRIRDSKFNFFFCVLLRTFTPTMLANMSLLVMTLLV